MQSYTYYLYHISTGKKYYGVRLKPKDIPENDLWIHYFSSSKKVKNLINEYGKSSFRFEVRKIFDNMNDALLWEQKVICRIRAVEREDWLNQNNNIGPYYSDRKGIKMSDNQKKKISIAGKGKKHTQETKNSISKTKTGKKHTLETKEKIRQSKLGKSPPNKGIPHATSTKEKIRIQAKNRYWIKNPITKMSKTIKKQLPPPEGWTFGRYIKSTNKSRKHGIYHWITNIISGENKQIKKDIDMPSGWRKGRNKPWGRGKNKNGLNK